jgi:hypothetical protein
VPDAATVADYLLFPMLGWLDYLKVRGAATAWVVEVWWAEYRHIDEE